jgi:hypothetical protein
VFVQFLVFGHVILVQIMALSFLCKHTHTHTHTLNCKFWKVKEQKKVNSQQHFNSITEAAVNIIFNSVNRS